MGFLSREALTSVFETETIGAREALSWIKEQQLQNQRIELKTDSFLVENLLEVGDVIEQCKILN